MPKQTESRSEIPPHDPGYLADRITVFEFADERFEGLAGFDFGWQSRGRGFAAEQPRRQKHEIQCDDSCNGNPDAVLFPKARRNFAARRFERRDLIDQIGIGLGESDGGRGEVKEEKIKEKIKNPGTKVPSSAIRQ